MSRSAWTITIRSVAWTPVIYLLQPLVAIAASTKARCIATVLAPKLRAGILPWYFVSTDSPIAHCLEFVPVVAYGDSEVWYDISTVPPGATDCDSYESCVTKTSKEGFNVGVMIEPVSRDTDATFTCSSLLCQYANCLDASRFPSDDNKVRNCPEEQHFNAAFCP